ncbi:DUF4123 domain-containing protein [Enterovibrio makurazakiensis]|uniref:DUF4123 domain-containing protein n=1 Tax=Enterovibrio makurazakiensis TaxID=2910232 RepID=UPI003D21A8DD
MQEKMIPAPLPDMSCEAGEQRYLLLDGSQIPDLETLLFKIEGAPVYAPVFLNSPWQELREVSPCVVKATGALMQWFETDVYLNQGYVFSSRADLETVTNTFRALIQVQSPYGSQVFFKMAHAEAAHILFSDENPQIWQAIEQAWLPTRKGWVHHTKPTQTGPVTPTSILLTDEQWEKLGQIGWYHTLEKIEHHLVHWFSDKLPAVSLEWIKQEAKTAYDAGFATERDLLLYFSVFGFLGVNVLDSRQYPDIQALINHPSTLTPSQRIEQAATLAEQYAHHPIQEQEL